MNFGLISSFEFSEEGKFLRSSRSKTQPCTKIEHGTSFCFLHRFSRFDFCAWSIFRPAGVQFLFDFFHFFFSLFPFLSFLSSHLLSFFSAVMDTAGTGTKEHTHTHTLSLSLS